MMADATIPVLLKLSKLLMIVFYIAHLLACIWIYIARSNKSSWIYEYTDGGNDDTDAWDTGAGVAIWVGGNDVWEIVTSVGLCYKAAVYWPIPESQPVTKTAPSTG